MYERNERNEMRRVGQEIRQAVPLLDLFLAPPVLRVGGVGATRQAGTGGGVYPNSMAKAVGDAEASESLLCTPGGYKDTGSYPTPPPPPAPSICGSGFPVDPGEVPGESKKRVQNRIHFSNRSHL